MAIFEYGGGESGLGKYLVTGQKSGRDYNRDELDERLVLSGDLNITESIIDSMDRAEGVERYKHITFSFKEDYISPEKLAAINEEIKQFFLSAYNEEEYCYYAEAHIPRIKSYLGSDGNLIERFVHLHIGIPTINLKTGKRLSPFEFMNSRYGDKYSTAEYLDHFQEYLNHKYNLASPKDFLRDPESAGKTKRLERNKSDDKSDFLQRTQSLPKQILDQVISRNITSSEEFEKLVAEFGTIKKARSRGVAYLKVQQPGDTKSIRLDDYVFTEEFLRLPTQKKLERLAKSGETNKYLTGIQAGDISKSAARGEAAQSFMDDWIQIRSREIRWLNPNSSFFRNQYRRFTRSEKIAYLDELEKNGTEFESTPVSTRLNRLTTLQTQENLAMGDAIRIGDQLAIEQAINTLTQHQSSFSKTELEQFLLLRSGDVTEYEVALQRFLSNDELIVLAGEEERYTSRTIHRLECHLMDIVEELNTKIGSAIPSDRINTSSMNVGQKSAFEALCSNRAVVVVNGAAGTGKSYILATMREAAESSGFQIYGAMLQGKTAEDLQRDSGIKSSTIHSFISNLQTGRVILDDRSVVVVDEAGMVGSAQFDELMTFVNAAGAKIRLIGDAKQVQAVSYGDAFANISKVVGTHDLTEIMRQRDAWQKRASEAFSRHEVGVALDAYHQNGAIRICSDQADAIDHLVDQVRIDRLQNSELTSIVVAKTNSERHELNYLIRSGRIDDGLTRGEEIAIKRSDKRMVMLAVGDQVIFTAPDIKHGLKNGSSGKVIAIKNRMVMVDVDGRKIELDPNSDLELDYGYAVTINKSQGMTVDKAYVLAHRSMTANDVYVAMTRHRESVAMFGSNEHFGDEQLEGEAVIDAMKKRMAGRAIKQFSGNSDAIEADKNLVDRLQRESTMESLVRRESEKARIKEVKEEIDLNRLLNSLQKSHGLNPEKYQLVTENKIKAGNRELDAVDFLTKEMHLEFSEAASIMRETYRQQLLKTYVPRQAKPTKQDREEFAGWIKEREVKYKEESKLLGKNARSAKKQTPHLAEVIQAELEVQRKALKKEYAKPNRVLYLEFQRMKEKLANDAPRLPVVDSPLTRVEVLTESNQPNNTILIEEEEITSPRG